jgi:hypothetical protein
MLEPRPQGALSCTRIADQCAFPDCDAPPAAVGIARVKDERELVVMQTCDDHVLGMARMFQEQDVDQEQHVFEICPTCRIAESHRAPSGAVGDYLIVAEADTQMVWTACERHKEEKRPRAPLAAWC